MLTFTMRILYSGIGIVDGSGKLNGTVMSKNKGGAYARTKVTPVNPQTTSQQNQRNILSTWSQGWRGLTPAQRSGWSTAAVNFPYVDRFGNVRQLSGFQLYCKLNINLNIANVAGIDDAPTPVEIPAITALTCAGDESALSYTVTFAPTPVPAGFALLIEAVANVAPGKSFVKNLFRSIHAVAAAGTSPYNGNTSIAAKFGAPVAGNQLFVRATMISTTTGQRGVPIQAQVVIVA